MFAAPMMLLVDTSRALDHESLRRAVDDMHDKGFDTICMEFRNCMYDEYDDVGQAAMKAVAARTQELGLRFVKIMPMLGLNIAKKYPEARQIWTAEHRGRIEGGKFSIQVKTARAAGYIHTDPSLRGIARMFIVEREERTAAIVRTIDVTDDISYTVETNDAFVLNGSCGRDGEYLAYVAYDTDYIDFSFKDINRTVDEYMELYDGLPLAGYAIDEFGTGIRSHEDFYLIGDAYRKQFRENNGYELLDKLFLLKNDTVGECAGKLRFDYYNQMLDNTYNLQKYVKDVYEAKYGKDLFGGFHSTWWGEGNSGDLWGGNIDYFRLTDNLKGGFVDAQFDAERTMTSMTMLAESLAKHSDSGLAYNMCWDRVTTPEKLDYYQRMLAVRNVRWVGHAYGSPGPYGPGYPDHCTWEHTKTVLRREKALQAFIGKAVSKPKIAMMYVWESVAFFNNDFMHYHRLSMKALLDKLLERHIEIDIVPTYDNDLERFEELIVLWPAMLPESAWSAIKAYAASGRKVCFIGPPAQCTIEGRDIRGEFAELTGAEACKPGENKRYEGEFEYVEWDIWFTNEKIPMDIFPLKPASGEICLKHGEDALGVRKANVEYYAFELPLTAYFDSVLDRLGMYRELDLPATVISKVSYDGDESILTLTGRWDAKLDLAFDFKGNRISIRGGILVAFKLQGDRIVEVLGEPGAKIEANGHPIEYRQI